MATLCSTYGNPALARSGVEALSGAGVPGRDVRLLLGDRRHDVRHEVVGGFAGPIPPDAPVGTFANVPRARWQGNGTFAGDSDAQRQASFADTGRDVVLTGAHAHVVGDLSVRRLLRDAGLDSSATDRVLDELHTGHAVVLAEVAEVTPGNARERLERAVTAA